MRHFIKLLLISAFVFQTPFGYSQSNSNLQANAGVVGWCALALSGIGIINYSYQSIKNREKADKKEENDERRHREKIASDKINREEQRLNREQNDRHHREKMKIEKMKIKWEKMNKKQKRGLIEQCKKQNSSLAEYEQWKKNLDIEKYIQELDNYMSIVDNDKVKKGKEGVTKLGDKLVSKREKTHIIANKRSFTKRTWTKREKEQDAQLVSELTKEFLKWDLDQDILNTHIFYGSEEEKAYNAHIISNLIEKYKNLGYAPGIIYKYFFWQGGPSAWITKYEEKKFGNKLPEKATVLADPPQNLVEEGYPERAEDYPQGNVYPAWGDNYNSQNYREPIHKQLRDLESMGFSVDRYSSGMDGYSDKGSGVIGGKGPPIEFDPIIIHPPLGGGGGGSGCVCYSDLDEHLLEMDIVFLCRPSFCGRQKMR